jgi:Transmembrane secretion effector
MSTSRRQYPRARPSCRALRVLFALEHPSSAALGAREGAADTPLMTANAPLRVAAFRRLATSYGLNELGWSFGTVALAVLVFDRTGSALATAALFLSTTFVPALLAPALTARLDALPVGRALPGLYLVEAALFGTLALTAERAPLAALLGLALLDGVLALVGRALTRAAVAAALKPSGRLEAGNRLLNVLFSVAYATGPAIAGAVVAAAGVRPSLAVTAGLFGLMTLALATTRSLPAATGEGDRSWRARLRTGVAYVRAHRPVRLVLGAHAAALSCAAAATPVEVVYAKQSLHAGAAGYGLVLAFWGIGTVLSSVALTRVRNVPPVALIPLGAGATGIAFLVMAGAPVLAVAVAGCVVGGAGNGVYYVSVVQSLQEQIDDDMQARVMSLLESTTASAYGVGFLAGGTIAALAGARATLAFAGLGVLVAAAAIVAVLRPARPAAATAAPTPELADRPSRTRRPSAAVETAPTS